MQNRMALLSCSLFSLPEYLPGTPNVHETNNPLLAKTSPQVWSWIQSLKPLHRFGAEFRAYTLYPLANGSWSGSSILPALLQQLFFWGGIGVWTQDLKLAR
jgi:hypothetical protein